MARQTVPTRPQCFPGRLSGNAFSMAESVLPGSLSTQKYGLNPDKEQAGEHRFLLDGQSRRRTASLIKRSRDPQNLVSSRTKTFLNGMWRSLRRLHHLTSESDRVRRKRRPLPQNRTCRSAYGSSHRLCLAAFVIRKEK